jgi:hypothetical protein
MWMGLGMGDGGRSRPIPPGRCPYLNCRRDTGLWHCPPKTACPSSPAVQMDVGKRVPGSGELGQEGKVSE